MIRTAAQSGLWNGLYVGIALTASAWPHAETDQSVDGRSEVRRKLEPLAGRDDDGAGDAEKREAHGVERPGGAAKPFDLLGPEGRRESGGYLNC